MNSVLLYQSSSKFGTAPVLLIQQFWPNSREFHLVFFSWLGIENTVAAHA